MQKNCGILSDPMGKADTRRDVPVVHPIIKLSEYHFIRNTAFADGTYQVLREQRSAYYGAPKIKFDDVVGFVLCFANI